MKKFMGLVLIFSLFFVSTCYVSADSLDCDVLLRKGSKGSNVKILQKKLNEYMGCNLEVDGKFGTKTYACVVKFQDNYNLDVDGIVGPKTCSKINSGSNVSVDNSEELVVNKKNNIVVVSDKAKIKYGVSSKSSVLKNVVMGDVLSYITTVSVDGVKWYKVKLANKNGYIKASDVSNNVILVDLSLQKLVYVKGGKLILNTNVVTGLRGVYDTPVGSYTLKVSNKEKARYLRGYNSDGSKYKAWVDYWMPFYRGYGFHDANWRSSSEFNDSTYIYDGSHGCVNMEKDDAKKLYTNIKKNTDVVIRD